VTGRTLETPVGAGGAGVPSRKSRLPGHRVRVGAVALAAGVAYAVLGLVKLATFRATTFDLVIVDQAVRNYAGLRPPYIPVRGMFGDRGMDYVQLADHFSPSTRCWRRSTGSTTARRR
jgi:hypothetical protein